MGRKLWSESISQTEFLSIYLCVALALGNRLAEPAGFPRFSLPQLVCVCVLFFPIRHRLGSPAPENILGNYFNCSAPTDLTSPNSMDCGAGGCSASGANFSKRIVDCVFLGVWSGLLYILYLLHPPLSIGHCHFNLGLHKTASIPIWLYNTLAGKWLPVLGKHPANYFAICSQALLNLPRMICTCAN